MTDETQIQRVGRRYFRRARTAAGGLLSLASIALAFTAGADSFNYTDIPSSSIPFDETNHSCTGTPLTRSFTVNDFFTINDLDVGFIADHTYRGDIEATLTDPGGLAVKIIDSEGGTTENLNVQLQDSAGTGLNDSIVHNSAASPYEHNRAPTNALSAFNGRQANGTWTLDICDNAGQDSGTYFRSELIFDGTPPVVNGFCPAGWTLGFPSPNPSYAASQTNTGVTSPNNAVGAYDNAGNAANGTNSAELRANDILRLDFGQVLAEDSTVILSLARNNSNGRVRISFSNDGTTETDFLGTFGNGGSLGVGTQDVLTHLSLDVSGPDYQYLIIRREAGRNWVDGASFSEICAPPASDYSDVPLTGTNYSDARHTINGAYRIGTNNTSEPAGYDSANATGDAGDDGVSIPALSQSTAATITVDVTQPASGAGYLQAWIDWNGDGDFIDGGEQIATNLQYTSGASGTVSVPVSVPAGATTSQTFARFRWSSQMNLSSDAGADDGEVEDYALTITANSAPPSPFSCDGRAYSAIGTPTVLNTLSFPSQTPTALGTLNPTVRINGIAYNVRDNFIYAMMSDDAGAGSGIPVRSILRVGSNLQIEELGIPTGPGTYNPISYAGTMDNDGNFYAISNSEIFTVSLGTNPTPGSLTYTAVSRSGNTSTPADITFSTVDGALYGMTNNTLVRIGLDGAGSTVTTQGDPLSGQAGGAWANAGGLLFFYNNSAGRLFQVDVSTSPPTVREMNAVTANGQFDATACKQPVIQKQAMVDIISVGGSFEYEYTLVHAYTTSITVDFIDNLTDPAITYAAGSLTNTNPGGGSVVQFDATNLRINNITMPPNTEIKFRVTVNVDPNATNVSINNQAFLNFGVNNVSSDDPRSADYLDPTTVTLITTGSLEASKSVDIWDPTSAGLYSIPGNDVIYTITTTNTGTGATDADTLVLIDQMPPEVEFYNGDIDDGGPETDPVSFTQTGGAGLSWSYGSDVAYSNAATKPSNFAACTYTPAVGYDPNVTYICFNPKGAMAGGTPDPTFSVSFRARIK